MHTLQLGSRSTLTLPHPRMSDRASGDNNARDLALGRLLAQRNHVQPTSCTVTTIDNRRRGIAKKHEARSLARCAMVQCRASPLWERPCESFGGYISRQNVAIGLERCRYHRSRH